MLTLGPRLRQTFANISLLCRPRLNADFNQAFGGAHDLAAQFVRGCPIVQVKIEILQNLLARRVQQFKRPTILGPA
jgi:hypothetical protein